MPDIEISRPRDGIVQLTMNRPDKLNAMTSAMVEELHASLRAVAADRTCRVIVLTGAGRGFCAGLDLNGYGEAPGFEWHGRVEKGLAVQKHIAFNPGVYLDRTSLLGTPEPLGEAWDLLDRYAQMRTLSCLHVDTDEALETCDG